jgi:DNA helicase-2/ATP-dependent DNA helicase PcrA
LRMPHHRRGRDDRHSYAPQSRFLTTEAVATMDVVESRAGGRPPALAGSALPVVAMPSLDALFE